MSLIDLVKVIKEQLDQVDDAEPFTVRAELIKQMVTSFLEMNDERVGWEHLCMFLFKKCQLLSYVHAGETPADCIRLECLRCEGIRMTYDPQKDYDSE